MAKREGKRICSRGPKREPLGYGQEQVGGEVYRFQQESSENMWEDNVQTREQNRSKNRSRDRNRKITWKLTQQN